jgi:hypothetical protein
VQPVTGFHVAFVHSMLDRPIRTTQEQNANVTCRESVREA